VWQGEMFGGRRAQGVQVEESVGERLRALLREADGLVGKL